MGGTSSESETRGSISPGDALHTWISSFPLVFLEAAGAD